jgi:hypothetical protein
MENIIGINFSKQKYKDNQGENTKAIIEKYKLGSKVVYQGATDIQVNWGQSDDPRGILIIGEAYEIQGIEIHKSHTKLSFVGVNGRFGASSFKVLDIKLNS